MQKFDRLVVEFGNGLLRIRALDSFLFINTRNLFTCFRNNINNNNSNELTKLMKLTWKVGVVLNYPPPDEVNSFLTKLLCAAKKKSEANNHAPHRSRNSNLTFFSSSFCLLLDLSRERPPNCPPIRPFVKTNSKQTKSNRYKQIIKQNKKRSIFNFSIYYQPHDYLLFITTNYKI